MIKVTFSWTKYTKVGVVCQARANRLLVVYPINGTMFGNDYPQQNKLSKCSLKYSVISVVHH